MKIILDHMENSKQFNEEQLEVIEVMGGYHLVLAPPGCGKTAVLAERILRAHQRGVSFADMACLTFTNRASRGMKERIEASVGPLDTSELFVGNVHRFCSQFLFANQLVPEGTTIIDNDMSVSIIADYMGEDELHILGDNKKRQQYAQVMNLQHLMYQCRKHYPSDLMIHREVLSPMVLRELCTDFSLSYSQDSVIELYEHIEHYASLPIFLSAEAQSLIRALYGAWCYEKYKLEHNLLDFEDLLLTTYDEVTAKPQGDDEEKPLKKFRWIQVDEVQDLNPLQLAIIDLFTAENATVVYLGDAQQAIFSFMGAKLDTLNMLRQRCGTTGLHNFYVNYRSPKYLLDIYNTYGEQQLGIAKDLLPRTYEKGGGKVEPTGQVELIGSETLVESCHEVAQRVKHFYETNPDETIAVVVAFNADADEVSKMLRVPHFKISGIDVFSTPDVHLLLSHFNVVMQENNFIAWARIFTGLKLFSSHSAARQFTHEVMNHALSPTDFLEYADSSYLNEFLKDYAQREFVIFDTETTGLNVFEDDVVQIAAIKVKDGRVVDELNVFVETDRAIPTMLGDTLNPLVTAYASHEHLTHREAMARFAEFAAGSILLGHNVNYDYQIMDHNMQRYCQGCRMAQLWPHYYDSLKLMHLVAPQLRSYKLKDLLVTLHLEGENSHMANDDILATFNVVNACYQRGKQLIEEQLSFLQHHATVAARLRHLYGNLYSHTRQLLYQRSADSHLVTEMQYVYEQLRDIRRIGDIPKLPYILDYFSEDMLQGEESLYEQLSTHLQEINTMKEADLCGSKSMRERVFVSTVHKAKGLEFDNVIVYDAVKGKFPSYFADEIAIQGEEARKFYVAISRAKKRLIVTYSRQSVSPWGKVIRREITPYLRSIRSFF